MKLIAENTESTVVLRYEHKQSQRIAYQSEAQLEDALIEQLQAQGYEYLDIHTEEELRAALRDALTQDRPVLYDIKVVHGSMTPGYESWWRVGVAEVSTQPRVQRAYEDLMQHVSETRKF